MRHIQRDTVWLWLIISVGALVRLYRLDAQSLWLDEGWQYFIASANSLSGVYARVLQPYPAHPPLSYLISHLFLQVENSDFFLRLPSVLFGIGSLPLCYLLARRCASPLAAVCAVVVLALSGASFCSASSLATRAPSTASASASMRAGISSHPISSKKSGILNPTPWGLSPRVSKNQTAFASPCFR